MQMQGDHKIRVYLEYELIYLAELRGVLSDLERAYNLLAKLNTATWKRISKSDRLAVETMETRHSVTITLLGGAALSLLADTMKLLAHARLMFHKSEETKWKFSKRMRTH